MFANAESLFYYTAFSRPTKKLLSQEEIKRLLAQATTSSGGPTTINVSAIERGKESPKNVNLGDMTIVELGDSQVSIDHEAMAVNKSKRGINRGDVSITELEESQSSIGHEATAVRKLKESPSNINREAMAVLDVDDDEGETQNDRMHFNQHDTNVDNEGHSFGDQQQTFGESDVQKVVLNDRSSGKIQQELSTDGQAESSGGMLVYDGVANGRIPDMETYEIQDVDEDATNYEDQIEVWLVLT